MKFPSGSLLESQAKGLEAAGNLLMMQTSNSAKEAGRQVSSLPSYSSGRRISADEMRP